MLWYPRRRKTLLSSPSSAGTGLGAACRIDQQLPLVLPGRRQAGVMSGLAGERRRRCRSHPKVLPFVLRAALTIRMLRGLDEGRLALFRASPEKDATAVIAIDGL